MQLSDNCIHSACITSLVLPARGGRRDGRSIGVGWLGLEVARGDQAGAGDGGGGGGFVGGSGGQRGDDHGAVGAVQDADVVDDAGQVASLVCHAPFIGQQARQA